MSTNKIIRKTVGEPIEYRGHRIEALYGTPCLLAAVDGEELPNFYESVSAAHNAGKKYVEQREKENKAAPT